MDDDHLIIPGGGNVFADLGLPEAGDRLRKAQAALAIADRIRALGLTQRAAAERLGVAQPDVSNILRGRLNGFSFSRLLDCIVALGSDVTISATPAQDEGRGRLVLELA